jgi:hypothetical protein
MCLCLCLYLYICVMLDIDIDIDTMSVCNLYVDEIVVTDVVVYVV